MDGLFEGEYKVYFAPNKIKGDKSQSVKYMRICKFKNIFKSTPPESSLFEDYFQFIHHSRSEETGGALLYKPILDVPFYRVPFFGINS